jgi:hypothetical protein
MKIDAILLGGVLGLAIFVSGWRAGISGLGRQILLSTGIFALVYTATNPQVLTDPGFVLTQITSTCLDAGHTPLLPRPWHASTAIWRCSSTSPS